jgi:polyphenol oxidase
MVLISENLYLSSQTSDQYSWNWHFWQDIPYLTCSLLDNWQHGFFTQGFSPRKPEDLVQIFHPDAEVLRVKQVHGNTVLSSDEIRNHPTDLPEADAIVSHDVNESVWVCTADCTPVLIADRKIGHVSSIHAGWRGTAAKIVPEAIARLLAAGSQMEDLKIALGPAIAGEVYQVDENVAINVCASIVSSPEKNEILATAQNLPNAPILSDDQPGKVRLDVRRVNEIQLYQLGIKPEQIAISPHCTLQQPEYFFSYRRTNQKNVQWSGILNRG